MGFFFGGVGGKNENYVMDGQKENDVISTAYMILLLWPISVVSGAFRQTRRKGRGELGEGGGRDIPICARKLEILKGDKTDGCSKKTSLYVTCLVLFIILHGRFDVRCGIQHNL